MKLSITEQLFVVYSTRQSLLAALLLHSISLFLLWQCLWSSVHVSIIYDWAGYQPLREYATYVTFFIGWDLVQQFTYTLAMHSWWKRINIRTKLWGALFNRLFKVDCIWTESHYSLPLFVPIQITLLQHTFQCMVSHKVVISLTPS